MDTLGSMEQEQAKLARVGVKFEIITCDACKGHGFVGFDECPKCFGQGSFNMPTPKTKLLDRIWFRIVLFAALALGLAAYFS